MTRMRLLLLLMIALSAAAQPCAAQEPAALPVGKYDVIGWNPDESTPMPSYSGNATIWRVGKTYLFEADMDGERYTGVGLFDETSKTLALQFNGTDGNGLTLLRFTDGKFEGNWVFGERPSLVGREIWTRRE